MVAYSFPKFLSNSICVFSSQSKKILTLYVINHFQGLWICAWILCHSSILKRRRVLKFSCTGDGNAVKHIVIALQYSPFARGIVTGGFPSPKAVMQSFDVFFDVKPRKPLSKQSSGRWSGKLMWRHCNVTNGMESQSDIQSVFRDIVNTMRYTTKSSKEIYLIL